LKNKLFIVAGLVAIVGVSLPQVKAQSRKQSTPVKENTYSVSFESRAYGDSIVLRWMPDDPAVWMLANRDGWQITRTGGKNNTSKVVKLVKPWTSSKMASEFGHSDLLAGAIAQAIYGDTKVNQALASNPSSMVEYVCRLREEQSSRRTIVSFLSSRSTRYADAAGLRFVDREVEKGATYEYTLVYAGKSDVFTCSEASEIVKNTSHDKKSGNKAVKEVSVKQIDASRVAVYWPVSDYNGFFVEKSLRGKETKESSDQSESQTSDNFVALNKLPVVKSDVSSTTEYPGIPVTRDNVIYIDSLSAGQTVVYRVRGYDLFGDMSEWQTSDAFTFLEQHSLSSPELVKVSPLDSNGCSVEWRLPEAVKYTGFVVAFSRKVDGSWSKVSDKIPFGTTSFADSAALKCGVGFYRVYAYDSLGRLAYSNILPNLISDTVPPTSPQVVRGKSSLAANSQSGNQAIVSLSWNEPKVKPDDLLGFRVYFSNNRESEFSEVTSSIVSQFSFTDTINMTGVNSDAYYYVVAVDNRFNSSSPSDTVLVRLPDVVKPEPCEWKSTVPGDKMTSIKWQRSKSDDVVKYNIYSQTAGSNQWRWVTAIDSSSYGESPYVTYKVPADGQVFPVQYCIEAVDASGNLSGRSGVVSLPANANADAGISLKAKYSRKTASVILNWQYSAKPDAKFIGIIYRTVDGEAPVAVGSFNPSQTSFTDSRLPQAKSVRYHIVLKSSQTSVSRPSASVAVAIK